jgi:glycosyltransferase involved in cell wall biosynthesis
MPEPTTARAGSPTELVSVVIPCLNSAQFVCQAIDSVLAQDHAPIECIVVDGGSTDGTLKLLERYADRIRWVSEPDRGHAHAINKGWGMSRGQVLAWLNADDCWVRPHAVRSAMDYLQRHDQVDVVYGDCLWIDSEGRTRGPVYAHPWDLQHAVEFADHCIPQPAAFIRRRILQKVGLLDERIFTKDRELWLRIGRAGTIHHLPRPLAMARNTRGISDDGRRVAPAIVEVTRKFFACRPLPSGFDALRRRAMSNAYLRGAYYAYAGGRLWDVYASYVMRAAAADPTNLRHVMRHVGRYVCRSLLRKAQA